MEEQEFQDLMAQIDRATDRIERDAGIIEELERGIDSLIAERDDARLEAAFWRSRVDG